MAGKHSHRASVARSAARVLASAAAASLLYVLGGPQAYILAAGFGLVALSILDAAVALRFPEAKRVSLFLWGVVLWSGGTVAVLVAYFVISRTLPIAEVMWIGLMLLLLYFAQLQLRVRFAQASKVRKAPDRVR